MVALWVLFYVSKRLVSQIIAFFSLKDPRNFKMVQAGRKEGSHEAKQQERKELQAGRKERRLLSSSSMDYELGTNLVKTRSFYWFRALKGIRKFSKK